MVACSKGGIDGVLLGIVRTALNGEDILFCVT